MRIIKAGGTRFGPLLLSILIPLAILCLTTQERYLAPFKGGRQPVFQTRAIQKYYEDAAVNVLFALSGSHPGFLAEFEAAIKSVLLNSPLDLDMDIHVMADDKAYGALSDVFLRTGLEDSLWRNKISIQIYNIESYLAEWSKKIDASTPWSAREMTGRHTIAPYFRWFAYQVLPETVEHVLYMDTDAVIMANLAHLWRNIDRDATFQWGADLCAGFMVFNVKKAGSIWDLASRCDLEGIQEKFNTGIDDQLILRAVNQTFPEVVAVLPDEWAISYANGAWKHKHDVMDFYQNVGMLHFNGQGSTKESYFNTDLLQKRPDTWGIVWYYVKLPWAWAKFMGECMSRYGDGQRLVIQWLDMDSETNRSEDASGKITRMGEDNSVSSIRGQNSSPVSHKTDVHQKPPINVLFALSGNHPGFVAEFEAGIKSVLLNSPMDSDMDIHIIADSVAYEELYEIFKRTGLEGSLWRNTISIKTYNADPFLSNFTETIKASTPWTIDQLKRRHTIGNLFGVFAYQVLPKTVEHLLVMDTDAVIMSNLADLWQYVDREATFQWGADMCAGFMMFNLKKAGSLWDLASRCDLKGIMEKYELNLGDQLILRAVNETFPEVVGDLPDAWTISYANGGYMHTHDIVDWRPNVGMLHFNGGTISKESYFKEHKVIQNKPDTWGMAAYYARLPWPWARFIGESKSQDGQGQRLVILHGDGKNDTAPSV